MTPGDYRAIALAAARACEVGLADIKGYALAVILHDGTTYEITNLPRGKLAHLLAWTCSTVVVDAPIPESPLIE